MVYDATLDSVRSHPIPDWFHDAKLGIFIHWGLYSVPGWAPVTGELGKVTSTEGWAAWFRNNPYAEWYLNSIRIADSSSARYHAATYGPNFSYDDFASHFNAAIQRWDPSQWAELFRRAGARYVVLTTKHHDGFLLWPSRHPNPYKGAYHAARDLVGELTGAVRAAGLRMGLYYSGGLDWTFNDTVIQDIADLFRAVPQTPEYTEYADAHWYELIERYQPSVLWNDIAYPAAADLPRLFAYYYNTVPEGVINDRFLQQFEFDPATSSLVNRGHFDFKTPEYASFNDITEQKWEATRGIGYSFGYNRNEGPENYLSLKELIHSFVDIVSKNGNLLLNVGPMADGTIPDLQRERLLGLGQWLAINGEAIYGTRPWLVAEGKTEKGEPVRFTRGRDAVYAVILSTPGHERVVLRDLQVSGTGEVVLLGEGRALAWECDDRGLSVILPGQISDRIMNAVAYTLKIAVSEISPRSRA